MTLNLYYNLASREAMKIQLFLSFAKITSVNMIQSSGLQGKYHKAKHILQTSYGDLTDSLAIIKYLARQMLVDKTENHLYGDNNFEKSLVDQWIQYYTKQLSSGLQQLYSIILCQKTVPKSKYHSLNHQVKHALEHIDAKLKLDNYICGNFLSIADLNLIADLQLGFRFLFADKYKKTIPYLTKWYQKISKKEEYQSVYGIQWACQKQLIPQNFLPQDTTTLGTLPSIGTLPAQIISSIVLDEVKSSKEAAIKRNNLAYQYFKRLLKSLDKQKKQKMNILWQTFQLLNCTFWRFQNVKNISQIPQEDIQKSLTQLMDKCNSNIANNDDYGLVTLSQVQQKLQIRGIFCFSGSNQPDWLKDIQQIKDYEISSLDPIKNQKDKIFIENSWSSFVIESVNNQKQKLIFYKMSK